MLHSFLENFKSENKDHYLDNLANAKNEGLLGSNEIRSDSFECKVSCRVVD